MCKHLCQHPCRCPCHRFAYQIAADPVTVEAINAYPTSVNLKEVHCFLGLAGWYHGLLPGFSQLAEPLNALKRKGRKFIWSNECQDSFDMLEHHLTSPPLLADPVHCLPFIVYTDASDIRLVQSWPKRKESTMKK